MTMKHHFSPGLPPIPKTSMSGMAMEMRVRTEARFPGTVAIHAHLLISKNSGSSGGSVAIFPRLQRHPTVENAWHRIWAIWKGVRGQYTAC